ncbi:MAG: DUF945 family protein [Pseudomonadota bacterium]
MRRWLILIIGIAVLVVLLSPGAVGRIAEATLSDNLGWIDSENDDVDIEVLAYERGWFSSTGQHRVVLADSPLAAALTASTGGPLAFVVDTQLDHGLIALAPLGSGSLTPRLASAKSTVTLDQGTRGMSDIPGILYSQLGVFGDSTFRYAVQPGEQSTLGANLSWSEADLLVNASARKRTLGIASRLSNVAVDAGGIRGSVGSALVEATHDRSELAFGVGELEIRVDDLVVDAGAEAGGRLSDFRLTFASRVESDGLAGDASVDLQGGQIPTLGDLEATTKLRFQGLDANAVEGIVRSLRAASDAPLVESMMTDHLMALAAGGGELDITDLVVSVAEGSLRATVSGDWPSVESRQNINWASFALKSRAEADVVIDSALYDALVTRMPEAGTLLALGLLLKKGDQYTMTAELSGGLLKVNGAPMPLGLP